MSENVVVLITNADDYGLTAGTNRGIERAHAAGTLSSTSVMVNQSQSAAAASLTDRFPDLGVGLHLSLTSGAPVTDPGRIPSLVDADGLLVGRGELLRRLQQDALVPDEVARECAAQLASLRRLGVEPDHWNVHQHMQEYSPIGAAVARAMADGGLRVARNPHRLRTTRALSVSSLLHMLHERRRRPGAEAVRAQSRTPDGLLEAHPAQWPTLLATLPAGVFEAICHPSEPDDELDRVTPDLTWRRVEELDALLAPELRSAVRSGRVKLSTFAAAFMP